MFSLKQFWQIESQVLCYINRVGVHKALCDNIDTRTVLDTMRDLLTEANKYMNSHSQVRVWVIDLLICGALWFLVCSGGIPLHVYYLYYGIVSDTPSKVYHTCLPFIVSVMETP